MSRWFLWFRYNIYSLAYRFNIPQRVPWNLVLLEACSLYNKSGLIGKGLTMLPGWFYATKNIFFFFPLWKVHSRSYDLVLLFFSRSGGGKGFAVKMPAFWTPTFTKWNALVSQEQRRFGLCKSWESSLLGIWGGQKKSIVVKATDDPKGQGVTCYQSMELWP